MLVHENLGILTLERFKFQKWPWEAYKVVLDLKLYCFFYNFFFLVFNLIMHLKAYKTYFIRNFILW